MGIILLSIFKLNFGVHGERGACARLSEANPPFE